MTRRTDTTTTTQTTEQTDIAPRDAAGGLRPPIAPMLARVSREIPVGDYYYEPKWDGFRCLAFRTDGEVDGPPRPAFRALLPGDRRAGRGFCPAPDLVLDGEPGRRPRRTLLDFDALVDRPHPAASRVARLRVTTPAAYIAFDMLERDGAPLLDAPFERRRAALTNKMGAAEPPIS